MRSTKASFIMVAAVAAVIAAGILIITIDGCRSDEDDSTAVAAGEGSGGKEITDTLSPTDVLFELMDAALDDSSEEMMYTAPEGPLFVDPDEPVYIGSYDDAWEEAYDRDTEEPDYICVQEEEADDGAAFFSEEPFSSHEIMETLSRSIVADDGTTKFWLNGETISAFARDRTDAFSVNTGASYNMWGNGVRSVSFNVEDLSAVCPVLHCEVCGETGTQGRMIVAIYYDRAPDDQPDAAVEFDCDSVPTELDIPIAGRRLLAIQVANTTGHENRVVFFNFSGVD